MTIAELAERQEQALAEARAAYDEISADGVNESRALELEREHDTAMAEYDRLGKRANQLTALEQAEQRVGLPDPNRPEGNDVRLGGTVPGDTATLAPEMRKRGNPKH